MVKYEKNILRELKLKFFLLCALRMNQCFVFRVTCQKPLSAYRLRLTVLYPTSPYFFEIFFAESGMRSADSVLYLRSSAYYYFGGVDGILTSSS
jgi:hypothetical protein